jgi:hypothetical protein
MDNTKQTSKYIFWRRITLVTLTIGLFYFVAVIPFQQYTQLVLVSGIKFWITICLLISIRHWKMLKWVVGFNVIYMIPASLLEFLANQGIEGFQTILGVYYSLNMPISLIFLLFTIKGFITNYRKII